MNNISSEKDFQKFLLDRLEQDNGFVIRKASNFDRLFAMDREMLFKFLSCIFEKSTKSIWRTPSSVSSM